MEFDSDNKKMKPMPVGSNANGHILDQTMQLLKLYAEFYPRITVAIFLSIIFCIFYVFVMSFQSPLRRNRVPEGYAALDKGYSLKAMQIDHWCLFVSIEHTKRYTICSPLSVNNLLTQFSSGR